MKNFKFLTILILCLGLIGGMVFYDRNQSIPVVERKPVEKKEESTSKQHLYVIGDQQCLGNNTFVQYLTKDTDMTYDVFAINGCTTEQLAILLGVYPMTLDSEVTIPSEIETVPLSLSCSKDHYSLETVSLMNPVTLGGIEGNLNYNEDGFTFTRLEYGDSKTVGVNEQVMTRYLNREKKDDDLYVLFSGFNDRFFASEALGQYVKCQRDIINSFNSNNYAVVGLISDVRFTKVKAYNDVLENSYKEHFVNSRYRILTEDMKKYGLEFNQQDLHDIQEYKLPASLKGNNEMINFSYHEILAKFIEEKFIELGVYQK